MSGSAAKLGDLVQHAQRFLRTPRGASTRVILGSSSKVRRKLMDELCGEVGGGLLKYDVLTADITRRRYEGRTPRSS